MVHAISIKQAAVNHLLQLPLATHSSAAAGAGVPHLSMGWAVQCPQQQRGSGGPCLSPG
jgi:hypothetical protein